MRKGIQGPPWKINDLDSLFEAAEVGGKERQMASLNGKISEAFSFFILTWINKTKQIFNVKKEREACKRVKDYAEAFSAFNNYKFYKFNELPKTFTLPLNRQKPRKFFVCFKQQYVLITTLNQQAQISRITA